MNLRLLRREDKTSRNIRMSSRGRYRSVTRWERWSNSTGNALLAPIRILLLQRISTKEWQAILIIILLTLTCHRFNRNSRSNRNQRTSCNLRTSTACWVKEFLLHCQRWIITQTWHLMLPPIDCLNLHNNKNQFKVMQNLTSILKMSCFSRR